MSMEIITIQNVRVYLDGQNTAWINAEDAARGLGFVEAKKFSTSGENYIRWVRVNGYFCEFGVSVKAKLLYQKYAAQGWSSTKTTAPRSLRAAQAQRFLLMFERAT